MPPLTTVIAIAVSCSVLFIVAAVVGTVIWVRVRHDRLSLAVANAKHGQFGLQHYQAETLTELSREEGTALRQYGQLPYGKPSEWGVLSSRESLPTSPGDSESSSPRNEKARRPMSRSLSTRSARVSKGLLGPQHLSSLSPLTERSEKRYSSSPVVTCVNERLSNSAVDGAVELPTETTPRHTPEREEEYPRAELTMRPISAGAWPLMHSRERSGSLYPVLEDNPVGINPPFTRVRNGSITAQTAGTMPEQPVPPPPCAYPPNRFRLSKNDSICFSSLSLETADSSILDESRRTSTNIDSDFTSPALPPCPTFAPFDANDVGRLEFDRRSFVAPSSVVPAPFVFPPTSSAVWEGQRIESGRTSPRRSLTARSPTSMERTSPPPRRSESVSVGHSRRESAVSVKPLDLISTPLLNAAGCNAGLLPYFSQMQRSPVHADQRRSNDPFYVGPAANTGQAASRNRLSGTASQESSLQSLSSHGKPPLASAMKSGNSLRKGHRRQNCVRISIHPPVTFNGPVFSPTAEEPEDVEEIDFRRSQVSELSASNVSLQSNVSGNSAGKKIQQSQHNDRLRVMDVSEDRQSSRKGTPKKRRHARGDSTDSMLSMINAENSLPEIVTTLPIPKIETSLLNTPSPETANNPAWLMSSHASSPSAYENMSSPGSPRRSAVKGPRNQPGRQMRNSYRPSQPLEDNAKLSLRTTSRPPQMRKDPARKPSDPAQRSRPAADQAMPRNQGPAGQSPYPPGTKPPPTQSLRHHRPQNRPPPPSSNPKSPVMQTGGIVSIWEDGPLELKAPPKSTVSLVKEIPDVPDVPAGKPVERTKSQGPGDRSPSKSSTSRSKPEPKTPTRRAVGLGIGAATPASLYDGDGFLKE
ncbi:uncharacterized protein BP01DRAFT_403500 [Aspergillus saccharolyticus JOP 1030-1]|uniref:Uncharacterized protein n=1 Tax=Aspergillus saccharolyticus JOP 1030-1 TaxID=1450539 RepID=A0A318ZX27_9EURO|nr:hypothetical protein BP01DRAFT_403500 [Aspergillus saccharolyticus JOP 1030-1]PYH48863.1 hypothetical protein BP01DRAFT_403500 [Aspergillus saccharolyticus JOP 1030-1]